MPTQYMLLPNTTDELAAIVRDANDDRLSVVTWGAGTRQSIGRTAEEGAQKLYTTGLNRLITHVPADMTVTVEAGMALGELQAQLRRYNQWLPWDPPTPPEATIGGLLASAASGPLRLGYGTPRDWVLGMRAVLGDGRIVKSGGNVVKNVAGYDLHKLHIGALGTLGIIAEVTFKVFPIPEYTSGVSTSTTDLTTALAWAEALRATPLAPISLLVQSQDGTTFRAIARYGGVEPAVRRQVALAHERIGNERMVETDQEVWADLARFAHPGDQEPEIVLRAGAAPAKLEHVLASIGDQAHVRGVIGYPGVGLVYVRLAADNDITKRIAALRSLLQTHGGYAAVEYAPAPFNSTLDLWGPAPDTLLLMRTLKQKWDSHNILNRGRYLV